MSVFLELRNGLPALDNAAASERAVGPVLGPFLGARLLRDELRVITEKGEHPLVRVADWLHYGSVWWADAELVPEEAMGPARRRRLARFRSDLAALPGALVS